MAGTLIVYATNKNRKKLHYKKVKVALRGFFNTSTAWVYCILTPTSSRIHLQRRHASHRCARLLPAKAGTIPPNFESRSVIYKHPLGSFTCRKAGTWDTLFYFLSEGRHTEEFPEAGLNPRTRVPVASMLTTRAPKPSKLHYKYYIKRGKT
jgi:hypothetical protein